MNQYDQGPKATDLVNQGVYDPLILSGVYGKTQSRSLLDHASFKKIY